MTPLEIEHGPFYSMSYQDFIVLLPLLNRARQLVFYHHTYNIEYRDRVYHQGNFQWKNLGKIRPSVFCWRFIAIVTRFLLEDNIGYICCKSVVTFKKNITHWDFFKQLLCISDVYRRFGKVHNVRIGWTTSPLISIVLTFLFTQVNNIKTNPLNTKHCINNIHKYATKPK